MTADLRIERAAIALCFIQAPAALFPRLDQITDEHRLAYWRAQTAGVRELYRYRASTVIEAFEAEPGELDAAAE